MHFSEDDLREALRRKDPGSGFTQRVMARVSQAEAKTAKTATAPPATRYPSFWRWMRRPALVSAAILLLVACSWLGFRQYERVQREKAEAKAQQQTILALRITTSKLTRVLERATYLPGQGSQVRRKSL